MNPLASRLPQIVAIGMLSTAASVVALADPGGQNFLLVSNREGFDILRYDRDTGALVDILVPAGSGGLGVPYGMEIGPDGHLYVASLTTEVLTTTPQVLKYDLYTGEFLGVVVPPAPNFNPLGITFAPDGDLVVNSWNSTDNLGRVLRFDMPGAVPLGDIIHGDPATPLPAFSTFGPDGRLHVSTPFSGVSMFDGTTGVPLGKFPTPGVSEVGQLQFNPDGSKIYVTDAGSSGVHVFDAVTGAALGMIGPGTTGMRFAPDGTLYVAHHYGNSIFRFDAQGYSLFAGRGPGPTIPPIPGELNGPIDIVLYSIPEPMDAPVAMLAVAGIGMVVARWKRSARDRCGRPPSLGISPSSFRHLSDPDPGTSRVAVIRQVRVFGSCPA